jgi:hypothetical protein
MQTTIHAQHGTSFDKPDVLGKPHAIHRSWDNPAQSFSFMLTPPNRSPTGTLRLTNRFGRFYVTNIRIWKGGTPADAAPDFVIFPEQGSGSIAPGQHLDISLPAGKNSVRFQAGPTYTQMLEYAGECEIELATTNQKLANFDFPKVDQESNEENE